MFCNVLQRCCFVFCCNTFLQRFVLYLIHSKMMQFYIRYLKLEKRQTLGCSLVPGHCRQGCHGYRVYQHGTLKTKCLLTSHLYNVLFLSSFSHHQGKMSLSRGTKRVCMSRRSIVLRRSIGGSKCCKVRGEYRGSMGDIFVVVIVRGCFLLLYFLHF